MKLSVFKKLIREVIREELDYSFSRLRKELKEVVVKSNNSNVSKAKAHTAQDTSLQSLMGSGGRTNSDIPISNSNINIPKTKNKVLNSLLTETANSEDWKTINSEPKVESVQDNTSELPEHLANAFNKDYSGVMKKVDEKTRFKNGA